MTDQWDTTDGTGIYGIPKYKSYKFEPFEDITAYELARALPAIIAPHYYPGPIFENFMSSLPEGVRRHFQEVPA